MTEIVFFDTMRQGLWVAAMMSLPLLSVALITGLSIGLLQALTSVQEMTLTFVPKLAAMMLVFWVTLGFMTDSLVAFFHNSVIPLVIGG